MRKNNTGTRSLNGKRFFNLRRRVLSAAIIAASQTAWVTPATAGPDGGRVVDGGGSIGRDGRNTTIHQRTDRVVIDWDSYNVAADEVVTYVQPGADAIALNRILSHSGSEIHGQINANGQVVLVNPHGVFFGKDAQVNVGGLIASGMTVDVSDFMNGDFTFSAVDGAEGKVINQGLINAATGGSVTLLGKQVRNDGLISARLGAVNLAAGKEAVVTFDEAGLMGVRISKEILQDELGVDAAVLNTGEIKAQGGRILLSASTSRDIFSQAVNRGDLEQATSAVVHEDGSFTLGGGADVVNTGTLNASSADRGAGDIVVLGENITQAGAVLASTQSGTSGTIEMHAAHTALLTENSLTAARAEGRGVGGTIQVLGHHVGLTDQATVDASGAWGGGQVYIGGDYQGDNPFMPSAWRSFVGDDVRINANALTDGDGGRIIVWADDITRFFGSIEGKGAGDNGMGGFAEVSGKEQLRFDGLADMRGPGGGGTLLLDPRDIIITESAHEDDVGPGASFDDGDIDQDFVIRNTTLESNVNSANVKLEATRNITVEAEIRASAENSNDLILLAGNNINIESQINLGRGNLYLTAGVFDCGDVGCYSGDGPRSVAIEGMLNTRGTIDIRAADDINLTEQIGNIAPPSAVSFRVGNDITIEDAGQITVSGIPSTDPTTTAISLIAGDATLVSENITVAPLPGGERNLIIGGNLNSYGTDHTRGGDIILQAGTAIDLGNVVIHDCTHGATCTGGNLILGGGGADGSVGHPSIAQRNNSRLDIAGATTINIGTGTATLNNNGNRFSGAVSGSAGNLEISGGDDGLTFGALAITGGLTATANGDITDLKDGESEHIIRVDGLASFNTNGNSLLLASHNHQLTAMGALDQVKELALKNSRTLDVGEITTTGEAGKVDINAAGNLSVARIDTKGNQGYNGGEINLAAGGTLAVGELDASGGARESGAHGHDGAPIELTGAEVILHGNISSQGSAGSSNRPHGTSGNITITGNTVIDPSDLNTITINNTGEGEPDFHSGSFALNGTLNGVYRPGDDQSDDDQPDNDDPGDNPAEDGLFTNLTINSSNATFTGNIGNSTELGNLIIKTYGDVKFYTTYFPQADIIEVNGLASDQELTAPDIASEWNITQARAGSVVDQNDSNAKIEFTGMSTLVGSSFDDWFAIATNNNFDLSIIGNRSDGANNGTAVNTLVGADRDNDWSITSAGGGTLNGQIQFQGFDSLVGGSSQDQFVLFGAGRVGQIDGGSNGVLNTVELEAGLNHSLSIGFGASNADMQLVNIGNVSASASDDHILVGSDQNNGWRIDNENAGTLNNQISFSGFRFLRGNTANDMFVITGDGAITGNIDGGDGGINRLELREISVTRALTIALRDDAEADLVIQNINIINSQTNARHTLVASNDTNIWSITGRNTGSLAGLSFNGMENLVGGTSDDTFLFAAAGDITGRIDGGDHETENTLDYSSVANLDITLGDDNDFTNIQHLIGNNSNSTLRATDQDNQWLLTSGVNAGKLNDDLRFTGITNLVGGAGYDVFKVNGGALTGGIQAGKGGSSLNLAIDPETNGQLRFVGGEGHDQIVINGEGGNYEVNYDIGGTGQERLSYRTRANGTNYNLLYENVAEVQDNVFADKLTLSGSWPGDEIILRDNSFHAPGYSEVHFTNKHNLTLSASSQHRLKLDGLIDISGTFEIQNAKVTQKNDQARIKAQHLILTSVSGFGTEDRPVHTDVAEADIRLGRADLYLHNQGNLLLNELTGSGTVSIQTEGALNSTSGLSLSGSTSLVSHHRDITLAGDNLLSGDITLSAAGNITLVNHRDTRLQGVQAQNFTLTSKGDITAPGVLTVDGLTTLRADGDISLLDDSNNLNELEIQQAENVAVHAGHRLNLAHVYSSGDVYTRTEGLTLSDELTANNFRFDAGAGAAVLDGQLKVSTLRGQAQGITVNQAIALDRIELDSRSGKLELNAELETRQDLTLRGTNIEQNAALFSGAELRVSSDADYHQGANVTATEDLRVNAGGDITMASSARSHTPNGEIRYQAGNNLALSSIDAIGNTVSLTASRGSISNNNSSGINVQADRLEMHAATGIGRDASLSTDIHVLHAQSQSGRLAVANQGQLQVDRMASNGNVRLSNHTGDIYLNNHGAPVFNTAESDTLLAGGTLTGNYNLGTVVVEVADGNLFALGEAHTHKPDLVGREVIMVARNGTVGSRNRPLVVYARDLSSTIAGHTWPIWWAFGELPRQVENDSGIPQELLDFAAAGSNQMVEVESLEDINPGIFTEVRNYAYGNIAVLLPPDQQYDDDY